MLCVVEFGFFIHSFDSKLHAIVVNIMAGIARVAIAEVMRVTAVSEGAKCLN